MNPETVLPDARESAAPSNPLERLLRNRMILFGAIGVVVVILVAYAGMAAVKNAKRKEDDRAWAAYHRGFEQLVTQAQNDGVFFPAGTSEFHQALDAEFQVRVLNDVAQEVRDTSAEPTTLFYLANAYLAGRKIDLAERTLDDLVNRYPDHYLTNASVSYLDVTLCDQLRSAIEREKTFLSENPNFLQGVAPEEDSGEGASEDGSGAADENADDASNDPKDDSEDD